MLTDKKWWFHSMQLTARSLLCSSKPFLCLLDPIWPQSAVDLALSVGWHCLQDSQQDRNFSKRTLSYISAKFRYLSRRKSPIRWTIVMDINMISEDGNYETNSSPNETAIFAHPE